VATAGTDHKQIVFSFLNPVTGRGREIARIDLAINDDWSDWQLSPDASRIAVSEPAGAMIHLAFTDGRPPLNIHLKGFQSLYNINWSSDGKFFFVSNPTREGAALLNVDLHGNAKTVWEEKGALAVWGKPSPDAHRIALMAWELNSNLWMMENF
jgi:hypothetical protein